ncbi:MAG: Stk1 family PASTA domain-containing Ser/Thr kinase [Erysipelotrichaceae bacterium]|nr:Stk1 family PASTA domain-containing Ser/Thr kinase [Erysipelotrichaceae bacterium]
MSTAKRVLANRYQLNNLIGQGGMADVYTAYDTILNREVAVKILRSSLTGDPIYITRFHREARAAAALSHKNIVAIYDVGEEDDLYYIVMEYVKGPTLKKLLSQRGRLTCAEAVDIMCQITAGVALAHSHGIIHRDIKPQNILVNDVGDAKIADFGIASIQSLSQVTQTNTIMGSLHYMAPEIAKGEKASEQSDIYALGIVFYELLRGEVPFNGESPLNIALKHMRDEMPSVCDFDHSIPQSVENIIIKATAKNEADRYLSANEMLNDLQTCLSRKNEEKLVFEHVEEGQTPTIIADSSTLFNDEEISPKDIDNTMVKVVEKDYKVEEEEVEPVKHHYGMIIGGVLGTLVIAAALVVYFFFIRPANAKLTMINVIGKTQQEAITLLENEGYEVDKNIREELSDEYDEGIVIATDPEADTETKKGDLVTLTVSKGKWIVMNDYVGKTYEEAEKELKELGFTVSKYEQNDEADAGTVIAQSIAKGEKQDPTNDDKKITLTVSKGIEITVPYLLGEKIKTAKSTCESAGFTVKLKTLEPPTDADEIAKMSVNTVVKQSLDPYTKVTRKGETITLYYYDHKPTVPDEQGPDDTTDDDTTENENNGE